jgi:hypothetical protein
MMADANLAVPNPLVQQMVENAGAQWVGPQRTERGGILYLFRDPVTGSTLALDECKLSVAAVVNRLIESRLLFSAAVAS